MRQQPKLTLGMARLFVRLNVLAAALATTVKAFDARFLAIGCVQHDSLIHYNMLLTWIRHGDSPRGFTLTPSPYFVDMLVQLPIMLLAPDFERFAYALGCAYAILIFLAVVAIARIILGSLAVAFAVAGVTMWCFYTLAPFDFVVHTFVYNHTSEIFTTLGVLALLYAWFRPGARRRVYAAPIYMAIVAFLVMSSPWFIITYCVPTAIALTALLGTDYVTRRRLAWFFGLTVPAALAGLIALSIVGRYLWPLRVDSYSTWWQALGALELWIRAEGGGMRVVWETAVAMIASGTLAIIGRRRHWPAPVVFMLVFFPVSVLACVGAVIKRGAFASGYEFRYFTFAWLLMLGFYATVAARLAMLAARMVSRVPSWLPWSCGALGVVAVVRFATCGGPLSIDDSASLTAPMLGCFSRIDGLKDGLATWETARYLNAALHAWDSPNIVVEIDRGMRLDARDNDLYWFDDGYRHGATQINFVSTHSLDDVMVKRLASRFGPPDRTVTCPAPINVRPDGKVTFDLWIWDRPETQRQLTDMVLHDNLRSPFAIGRTEMTIDVDDGMSAAPDASETTRGHHTWRAAQHPARAIVVSTNPLPLPGGHYRAAALLSIVPTADRSQPFAYIVAIDGNRHLLAKRPITSLAHEATVEFEFKNTSATSGNAAIVRIVAGNAESIDVTGATLELLDRTGISPFQIFH